MLPLMSCSISWLVAFTALLQQLRIFELFNSSRVRAALAYEAEKVARVAAEKAEKEAKKAQAKKTLYSVR